MPESMGRMVIEISAKLDRLQDQLRDAEGKVKTSGEKMENSFMKLAGAAGLAFGTGQMIAFGEQAILLAAKIDDVKRAFDRFGSANMLERLRQSVQGTASDLALMTAAVKANNFQIPLDQLGTLLEFASRRARDTGESVDYLVDSIVTGISRKSIMILDNLGISATRLKDAMSGASLESKSVGEVTAVVAKIAKQELDKMGDSVDSNGVKIARMKASWENFSIRVGQMLAPLADGFTKIAESLLKLDEGFRNSSFFKNYSAVMDMNTKALQRVYSQKDGKWYDNMDAYNKAQKAKELPTTAGNFVEEKKPGATPKTIGEIQDRIKELQEAMKTVTPSSKEAKKIQDEITMWAGKLGLNVEKQVKSISDIREEFYNKMKGDARGYYDYELKLIAKQEKEYRRAGMAEADIQKWKLGKMADLTDQFLRVQAKPMEQTGSSGLAGSAKNTQISPLGYSIEKGTDAATVVTDEFWAKQMDYAEQLGNVLGNALSRSADEGTQLIGRMLNMAVEIMSIIASMKSGETDSTKGGIGIFGSVLGFIAPLLHSGGTMVATPGGLVKAPGFAGGTDFMVPAGYPRDSFPMMVESGERVRVTPAGKVRDEAQVMRSVLGQLQVMNYRQALGGNGANVDVNIMTQGILRGNDIEFANRKAVRNRKIYG